MSTTPKVRVGFISPLLFETGGTETWHRTLWRFLDRERVEIVGLAVLDPEQFHEGTANELRKIAPVHVGASALRTLASQVDVLIMWGIANPHDYYDFNPDMPPQTIFVSHGAGNSRWTCSVVKSAVQSGCIDQFVGVSASSLEPITKAGTTGVVIHNGVDIDKLRAESREWAVPNVSEKRVLGFVGRLSTEKRPECLVEAIARLPEHWQGVFVGKDYLNGKIQALAKHHCPGRISFLGQSNAIGAELSLMDALLVPSAEEGFGLQIAEAWAAGVPVISCPVGIALECPDLVRPIPALPTGLSIAQAVLEDEKDVEGTRYRKKVAVEIARHLFSARSFGYFWSNLICKVAGR